jgi:hypothetical protein
LEGIRQASNKGLALGNEHLIANIEAVTGKGFRDVKKGRPPRCRKTHRGKLEA